MESEGNVWKEAWNNAKPVPSRRQKRLFDDTREAEKVLQYLTALRPGEAAHMLMPVLQHASIVRILSEGESILDGIPQINDIISDALNKLSAASRLRCMAEVKHFKSLESDEDGDNLSSELIRRTALINEVIRMIRMAEIRISQAFSLQAKFLGNVEKVQAEAVLEDKEAVGQQMKSFVKLLYTKPEVNALGAARGPVGQLVTQMFREAHRAAQMVLVEHLEAGGEDEASPFPRPISREFVLKVNVGRPYTYSQSGPQRLYCRLRNYEFRAAGAFTIDKQFM
jgi:Rab3 GTPase-activating protein catalytic subunit